MTFYDSLLPGFDYGYYPSRSYGQRYQPQVRRYVDPYSDYGYQRPSHLDFANRQSHHQAPKAFPSRQQKPFGFTNNQEDCEEFENSPPRQSFYNYNRPSGRAQPSHPAFESRPSRNSSVSDNKTNKKNPNHASDGIRIPIRRVNPDDQSTNQKKQSPQKREKAATENKVAVDRRVLSPEVEDPLIVEVPIDQILPEDSKSEQSQRSPGHIEFVWEDEDDEDVIETIVDCSASPSKPRLTSPASMTVEEPRAPSPEVSETDLLRWRRELETFDFLGFHNPQQLVPLFEEMIGDPSTEAQKREAGLQRVFKELLRLQSL